MTASIALARRPLDALTAPSCSRRKPARNGEERSPTAAGTAWSRTGARDSSVDIFHRQPTTAPLKSRIVRSVRADWREQTKSQTIWRYPPPMPNPVTRESIDELALTRPRVVHLNLLLT